MLLMSNAIAWQQELPLSQLFWFISYAQLPRFFSRCDEVELQKIEPGWKFNPTRW
jgi:hypothetical protein